MPEDFEVVPLRDEFCLMADNSLPLMKPEDPEGNPLIEQMNGVEEAICEMLEEPEGLARPSEHDLETDQYLPLPTRTTPFTMPITDPNNQEEDPLWKAI